MVILNTTDISCRWCKLNLGKIGKSNLLILIALLTPEHVIQVSFQTFLTVSLLGYNKINLSLVSPTAFQVQVQYIIKLTRAHQGSLRFFISKSNDFLKLNC